jgi:hypothetical protein
MEGSLSPGASTQLLFNNHHQRQQTSRSKSSLDTLVVMMMAVNLWKGSQHPLLPAVFAASRASGFLWERRKNRTARQEAAACSDSAHSSSTRNSRDCQGLCTGQNPARSSWMAQSTKIAGGKPRTAERSGPLGEAREKLWNRKGPSYCRASIRRVMVRFNSLSDRRISSILWMEWSTVV